jgi:hypothetical protein
MPDMLSHSKFASRIRQASDNYILKVPKIGVLKEFAHLRMGQRPNRFGALSLGLRSQAVSIFYLAETDTLTKYRNRAL